MLKRVKLVMRILPLFMMLFFLGCKCRYFRHFHKFRTTKVKPCSFLGTYYPYFDDTTYAFSGFLPSSSNNMDTVSNQVNIQDSLNISPSEVYYVGRSILEKPYKVDFSGLGFPTQMEFQFEAKLTVENNKIKSLGIAHLGLSKKKKEFYFYFYPNCSKKDRYYSQVYDQLMVLTDSLLQSHISKNSIKPQSGSQTCWISVSGEFINSD